MASLYNQTLLLRLLFLGIPLADALYGMLVYFGVELPISLGFRLLVVAYSLGVFVMFPADQKRWLAMFAMMLLLLASAAVWSVFNPSGVAEGVGIYLKSFYFLIILNLLLCLSDVPLERIVRYASFYAVMCAPLFVFSFVTGIGFATYGDYAFGTKSFFFSGNDIGLTVFLSSVFSAFGLIRYRKSLYYWPMLCGLLVLALLGTKTSFIFTLLLAGLIVFVWFSRPSRAVVIPVKLALLSCVPVVLVLSAKLIGENLEALAFQLEGFKSLLDAKGPRDFLIVFGKQVLSQFHGFQHLFGVGGDFYHLVGNEFFRHYVNDFMAPSRRAIESDIYDLWGCLGLISLVVILAVYVLIWRSLYQFYRNTSKLEFLVLWVGFGLVIAHGLLAGHVMGSPQVALMAGMCGYLVLRLKSNSASKEVS
ncbi:O-antigen ligase family protein [Paraferrimonas sedimenticola]|uniref:O-antigen ligase n=1 Tax=Paraferrimonas sedimenticola TaxID=375674 RepID=A0AA37W0Z1_9GAMM|nr:O-antigen ligase family protein [Paraferrimonas sedimenticola]GLP96745.1 hypothetical protein GCM10007895_20510 [Paraferrimonas sedimenticola]